MENLTPFFSHDFADIYNAASNPNGYWYINPAYSPELGNVCTQLSDGWAHIEMDNSAKTTWAYLNIYLRPLAELKPNTEYTLLIELRNVTVGGTTTGNTRYILLEQADTSTQISQTVNSNGYTDVTLNQDGTIYKALVTKPSFDGCTVFCRNTIRVGAGNTLSCDMRLSLYETTGENILLDTNAPTLTKINAPYDRYFSDTSNTAIVPTYGALTGAPYEYGAKFVYDGSYTNARRRGLGFYTGTTVGTIYYEAGKQYQATYWARCTSGKGYASVGFNNSTGAQSVVSQPTSFTAYAMTSEWRKYTVSVRPTVSGTWSRMWFFANFAANTAGTVEICGFSLREMTATYEQYHEYEGGTPTTPKVLVYSHEDVPQFEIDPQQIVELKQVEEINGEHSLTITTLQELVKEQRVLIQDNTLKWREYVVTGAEAVHEIGTVLHTYYCVWSVQHDLQGTKVSSMPGTQNPVTASVALEHALAGTSRWNKGTVTQNTTGGVSMYFMSGWEALSKVVEVWGGEVDPQINVNATGVVTRVVNLYSKQGNQKAVRRFDYGSDLTTIKRTVSDEPFVCRIIPRGKGEETESGGYGRRITIESVNGGIEYLEDADAVPLVRLPTSTGYEYPTQIIINENIETPAALKEWAQSVMTEYTRPKVTYEAGVLQLSQAGMDVYGVELGDAVQCVDKGFTDEGLRIDGRVVKIESNLLDPTDNALTIGYIGTSLASQLQQLQNNVATVAEYVEQLQGDISTPEWIDGLVDRINAEVNATGGYTYIVQGNGIRTYDKAVTNPLVGAEADAVVEIKGGTIRIANSKDAQGNWEWRTVFTAGHIAGDLVTSAQLVTGFIAAGGFDEDPSTSSTYINLDTGEVRIDAITSQIEQAAEGVTITVTNQIATAQEETLASVADGYTGKEEFEQSTTAITNQVDELGQSLNTEIEQRQTYYRFDSDAMTIGKSDSELQLQLTNDRISFMDEGAEVAYASGGEFYAPNMAVDSQLRLGRWAWVPRSNGNLALKWLG